MIHVTLSLPEPLFRALYPQLRVCLVTPDPDEREGEKTQLYRPTRHQVSCCPGLYLYCLYCTASTVLPVLYGTVLGCHLCYAQPVTMAQGLGRTLFPLPIRSAAVQPSPHVLRTGMS